MESNSKLSEEDQWEEYYKTKNLPVVFDVKKDKHRLFSNILKDRLPKDSNYKLLEVGCGASAYLPYFEKEFSYSVFGIDYIFNACRLAKKNMDIQSRDGNIICSDIFEPGFPPETFDVIFSSGVIEHFKDQKIIIKKFLSLLRKNGYLVVFIPNTSSIPFQCFLPFINRKNFESHVKLSPNDLYENYAQCGLSEIESSFLGTFKLGVINEPWVDVSNPCLNKLRPTMVKGVNLLEGLISKAFQLMNCEYPNQYFSPYSYAIGRKK